MKMIELRALEKRYGNTIALKSVDLRVDQGDIYGLVGVPQSGKTTLLRLIAGYETPTGGSMVLLEGDEDTRGRIGMELDEPALLPHLNAYDNLMAVALAAGVVDASAQCMMLLQCVGLTDDAQRKVRTLPLVSQRLLGVALALVGLPDVLLLDEPVKDLGLRDAHDVCLRLRVLAQEMGLTMMVSAKTPAPLMPLAMRFGFLESGTIVREMNVEALAQGKHDVLVLRVLNTDRTVALLNRHYPHANVSVHADGAVEIRDCTADEVGQLMCDNNQVILELITRRGGADDIFADLLEDRESLV